MMQRVLCVALGLVLSAPAPASSQGIVTLNAGVSANMQVAPGGVLAVPLVLDMSQANGGSVSNLAGTIGWNPAALTLDSLVATSFGATSLNLVPQSAGGATYQITGAQATSSTTQVAIAYFTAVTSQTGSRIQLTVTSANNAIGKLALGRVLTRNADVCVAPIGVWGDANGDAAVDIIDAQQIARHSIGLSVANGAALLRAGDVNADLSVNIVDAQQIARFVVSLPAAARVNSSLFTPPTVASLVLDRSTFSLTNGLQVPLIATPLDAAGQAIPGCHSVTWGTSDPAKATVNGSGLVRGSSSGVVTITATLGTKTAQSTITVVSPDTTAALRGLRNITAGDTSAIPIDGAWMLGGLLADEWKNSDTFAQRRDIDQRAVADNDALVTATLRAMYRARSDASGAIPGLIASSAPGAHIARMYFIQGYVELLLAENFCNGVYLNDASTGLVLTGPQVSNAQLYARAIAHFDSALVNATATDAFTVSVKNLVSVAKGRALLQTAQYAAAAAAVAGVSSSYLDASTLIGGESNKIWRFNINQKRYTLGDTLAGEALLTNFRFTFDQRLPVTVIGLGQDLATSFSQQGNYAQSTVAPLFTYVDAQLIVAEQQLQANNLAGMTATLNALRASPQQLGTVTTTSMPAISTPTNFAQARAILFQERALWSFGRGQRLGDLRRLMRAYGLTEGAVFPSGPYHKGGSFGTIKNLPAAVDEEGNVVTLVCTDRNP